MHGGAINILSTSEGPEAVLSNFAATPFCVDGVACGSVEGFLQGLKEEGVEKQGRICLKHGYEAKRASTRKRNRKVREGGMVWWLGRAVPYQSEEYYALIERAMRGKFAGSEEARRVLKETGGAELTHETGKPEAASTSFPKVRFLGMLNAIRAELLKDEQRRG